MNQVSIFDGGERLMVKKPVRLIELFAGYGSQALAMKYLGIPFEHFAISEWAIPSIKAYKNCHHHEDKTDYTGIFNKDMLVDYFCEHQISRDYNVPLGRKELDRMKEQELRDIFNDACSSKNLLSICNIKGKDLVFDDEHTYIMSYSFPCQDLSNAGLKAGMEKGSNTRSGMLWEVERILLEMVENKQQLPHILLMENVPQVICPAFSDWIKSLDNLGYNSKWQILNTTDFKIPQNRERCFMVSWLDPNHEYYYDFPAVHPLDIRLKHIKQNNVDEKYYLELTQEERLVINKNVCSQLDNVERERERERERENRVHEYGGR